MVADELWPPEGADVFHLQELVEIHERFLEKLRDAISANPKHKLSHVFLEFREPFLIYGDYCSCMTEATDTLREVSERNSAMDQLVQQCQKEHSGGRVQLRDILSVPMQRILKYPLLLNNLVSETLPVSCLSSSIELLILIPGIVLFSQTHEEYRSLERAKEAMVDVSQYINEVKRDSENLALIHDVKVSIPSLSWSENHWR